MNDLRTSLHRVADTVEPLPLDDDLWQRGVASRRRGQALVAAAVVAIIASVTWSAVLLRTDDREARTASGEVVEGAIPSRIEDPSGLTATEDLAVGRASVAFVDDESDIVVVTAADGRYHALAVPGAPVRGPVRLSPDGTRLAYAYRTTAGAPDGATESGTAILDLRSGEVDQVAATLVDSSPVRVSSIGWSPDSAYVAWSGKGVREWGDSTFLPVPGGGMLGVIDVATGSQSTLSASEGAVSADNDAFATLVTEKRVTSFASLSSGATSHLLGEELPGTGTGDVAATSVFGDLTAVTSSGGPSIPFVTPEGEVLRRGLDPELYPAGAQATPLGWADVSLVVAQVTAPAGSYVEGRHLTLLTSPDRPEAEWTYRILVRDVADVADLSVAVDLVPDLDGTTSQRLTHDFGDVLAQDQRDISWIIGLGVAAAIAVLLALRWLWRRRLG